ncbi:hypothetical protein MXD81_06205 [Microbacteriaceae bacterium K1510]|nr:hypothetical protein [Microbacteriaceae bacterium K1510]
MSIQSWATIHPSAFADAGRPLQPVNAVRRAQGAVRYRCPINGSFVLVTESASLKKLMRSRARLRCASCSEMHMIACEAEGDASAVIVGTSGPA